MRSQRRIRRHIASLRKAIATWSDIWLLVRMLGWSAFLPVAKRLLPLPRLVAVTRPRSRRGSRDPALEARIASLAAWVFTNRPGRSRDNCLERALVTYRYLSRAGADPELVIGMAPDAGGVRGHAWVTVEGTPIHDSPERLGRFESLVVFTSDGRMIR
jgi:hypothetical protein